MRMPRSLQARLALSLAVLLTLLWIAAASVIVVVLRHEMDEVFDSALQETTQRLLPLVVLDILGRDEGDTPQRLAAIRDHDEFFTYIVRDATGHILLQSHAADPLNFPAYDGPGFRQTPTHRLFSDDALQDSIRITVAEPLEHRAVVAQEIQMVLGLPILIVIPVALLTIILTVRGSLGPLRQFQTELEARNVRDLSPVPTNDLPTEIGPIAGTLNGILRRLKAAFDAERSFAANAAHELRTPLAGAIAQAQRLQVETKDLAAARRAGAIETSLKRLTRMAERLLQLARAEGGPLRLDHVSDLRPVATVIVEDIRRLAPSNQIHLTMPKRPILSDMDPDAFGIVCRNLVENALRHGEMHGLVDVTLGSDGTFRVANDGAVVPPETLHRLTLRFDRGGADKEGSGLGLAIVAAIAERISTRLVLVSPRPGSSAGFEASLALPVVTQAA
ncbi:MAG: ATP-binding protein [Devosia sp.]